MLTNASQIKKFAKSLLDERRRQGRFTKTTQVGDAFTRYVEREVRRIVEQAVEAQGAKERRLRDPWEGVTPEMRAAIKPRPLPKAGRRRPAAPAAPPSGLDSSSRP